MQSQFSRKQKTKHTQLSSFPDELFPGKKYCREINTRSCRKYPSTGDITELWFNFTSVHIVNICREPQ